MEIEICLKGTEALLAGITRKPRTRAGLILGIDATASREHCWDIASQLQSEMFQAAAGAGGLEAQLVYYRGLAGFDGECKASPWTDNAAVLVKLMSKIRCLSGVTQIGSVLKHTLREASQRKVGALCFVGDAAEEPRSSLISPATRTRRSRCSRIYVSGRRRSDRAIDLQGDRQRDGWRLWRLRCRTVRACWPIC